MTAITTGMIKYPSDDRTVEAYRAMPESGSNAGIVVIQEWWGLVDHIKDVADRFASEGFVALAPDLYYGQQADEPDDARKLAMEMDRPRAVDDLVAACDYLRRSGCLRVGAIGFCMGGALVLEVATHAGAVNAAAPYYGRPLPKERAAEVDVPLLGVYGGQDTGIPVESVQEMSDALKQHGKDADIHIYPDAKHAFFNDTRPESYHPEASADAWAKTIAFFKKTLIAQPVG